MAGSVSASVLPLIAALLVTQQRNTMIDAFESPAGWSTRTSEGVTLRLAADSGFRGRSMRLDFDFGASTGAAVARKTVNLALPPNYELAFQMRGDGNESTVQIRLLDQAGAGVWVARFDDLKPPKGWTEIVRRKHQFSITRTAKPVELIRMAAIELAITAASAGRGTLWIDELQLRPREPDRPGAPAPLAIAASAAVGHAAQYATDGDSGTSWRSAARDSSASGARSRGARSPAGVSLPANAPQTFVVDFIRPRELGGLIIDWEAGRHAITYTVELSATGKDWDTRSRVTGGDGGRDYVFLAESEARFVRVAMSAAAGDGFGIRDITVMPVEWALSRNAFFTAMAGNVPTGSYPKYVTGAQSYWTAAGADGDDAEVIVNEEGMVEAKRSGVGIEPFVYLDDRLFTWHDVKITQSLAGSHLPEPSVAWDGGDWSLTLAPVVVMGPPDSSVAYLQYHLTNRSRARREVRLYLAIRPFQVVGPTQVPGLTGGVTTLRDLSVESQVVRVNGEPVVVSLTPPAGFGAATFHEGTIVDHLRRGALPASPNVSDASGDASGALAYTARVDSGEAAVVEVALPLHPGSLPIALAQRDLGLRAPRDRTADARRAWRDAIERTTIELPPSAGRIVNTLYASVGQMLLTRDHAALRAGARGTETSRMSDGALQAAALIRLGRSDIAREFLEWYARHQESSGRIPCCIGARGADPAPEHDAHGAFIYLVAEYWRYTGDREVADRLWPNVARAAAYIDSLRRLQTTADFQTEDKRAAYGLLPPSANRSVDPVKPIHRYRDDFFALRGLKDAVELAHALNRPEATELMAMRDGLQRDLYASIQLAMVQRGLDLLPASAEPGGTADADPMLAFLAVSLMGEVGVEPESIVRALDRTLERYWEEISARRAGMRSWDAYASAELRSVGALVRLGRRDRAHALLDWFLQGQHPSGWLQWADSVRRDSSSIGTVGDMPSSTASAAYASSVLDMLAYGRESDSSLVVAAGVPESWVNERPGVTVRRLPTTYGSLSFTMRREATGVRISMQAGLRIPPGGIVVHSPFASPVRQSLINGIAAPTTASGAVVVRALPAEVVFRP
jgi:hypothetical protein